MNANHDHPVGSAAAVRAALPPMIFWETRGDGAAVRIPRPRLMRMTIGEARAVAEAIGWPLADVTALTMLAIGGTVVVHPATLSPLADWAQGQWRVSNVGSASIWRTPYPGDNDAYALFLLNDRPDLGARIGEIRNTVLACDCDRGQQCHAIRLGALADLRLGAEIEGVPLPADSRLKPFLGVE